MSVKKMLLSAAFVGAASTLGAATVLAQVPAGYPADYAKIVDGAKTANLTLVGTYVTSNFVLSNDGHGGTFVADPPITTPAPPPTPAAAQFVQAAAGLHGEAASPFAGIQAGGTAMIAAAVVAVATSGR